MKELINMSLQTPASDAIALAEREAEQYLADLDGWKIALRQGMHQLQKCYKFKDYQQAVAFTNQAAELAEAHQHHPAITTEWGKVTVYWWTHSLKGLHLNDFIMAAKTDSLIQTETDT